MKHIKTVLLTLALSIGLPASATVVCSQIVNEHGKAFHYSMNGQADYLRGYERSKIYFAEVAKPDSIAQRYRLLGESLVVTGQSVEPSSQHAFNLQVEPLRDKTRHHCDAGYLIHLYPKR